MEATGQACGQEGSTRAELAAGAGAGASGTCLSSDHLSLRPVRRGRRAVQGPQGPGAGGRGPGAGKEERGSASACLTGAQERSPGPPDPTRPGRPGRTSGGGRAGRRSGSQEPPATVKTQHLAGLPRVPEIVAASRGSDQGAVLFKFLFQTQSSWTHPGLRGRGGKRNRGPCPGAGVGLRPGPPPGVRKRRVPRHTRAEPWTARPQPQKPAQAPPRGPQDRGGGGGGQPWGHRQSRATSQGAVAPGAQGETGEPLPHPVPSGGPPPV